MQKKRLIIQVQPNQIQSENVSNMTRSFAAKLESCGQEHGIYSIEISTGDGNIDIKTSSNNPGASWKSIYKWISTLDGEFTILLGGMIVVSEGPSGWNDYKLLYHYDKAQSIDEI